MPELLDAAKTLSVSQTDRGNRLVKRFHLQAVVFGELLPNFVKSGGRFIKPVMHRVDTAGRVSPGMAEYERSAD
jgi:hypothetical protein